MKIQISFRAVISACLVLLATPAFAADGDPDISDKARSALAQKALIGQPQKAALYIQGMVCSSCAIGVRVHLKKIKGIDREQENDGIIIDQDSQLAYLSLKPDHAIEPAQLRKAVEKAGYKPVHAFFWNGQTVQKLAL